MTFTNGELLSLILGFCTIIFASNGILVVMAKHNWEKLGRKDETRKKLDRVCEVNDRQGPIIILTFGVLGNLTSVMKILIRTLHDKGVMNGESVQIISMLDESELELKQYEKDLKKNQLMMKETK